MKNTVKGQVVPVYMHVVNVLTVLMVFKLLASNENSRPFLNWQISLVIFTSENSYRSIADVPI